MVHFALNSRRLSPEMKLVEVVNVLGAHIQTTQKHAGDSPGNHSVCDLGLRRNQNLAFDERHQT